MKAKAVFSVEMGCWDIEVIEGNPGDFYIPTLLRGFTNPDHQFGHLIVDRLEDHNPDWEIRLNLAGS